MTAIENIAWIVIIVATIKMLVLLVSPMSWMNFASKFYKNKGLAKIVSLALAVVIFYYLYMAGITVVQILAVTAFVGMLLVLGLADEFEYFIKKYQAMVKKGNLWKEYWLYTLIWIVLLIWGVKELLM